MFQHNLTTGDRRINGSLASLAGLEQALTLGDEHLIHLATQRILLGHALICGFGGLPLIYMGDEIGLLNNYDYVHHDDYASDSRWLHRPAMDWARLEKRHDANTIEGRLYQGFRQIIKARRRTPQLGAQYDTDILDLDHSHLFAVAKRHPLGTLACVYNFSESTQHLNAYPLFESGVVDMYDTLSEREITTHNDVIELPAYARLWLV